MVESGLADGATGPILAALIAGVISLLGLIISKEQKVSDFRQAWIDALRAEIAAVITHANAIYGAHLAKFPGEAETWRNCREDFVAINEAWAKIRLRLNPNEESSRAILRALKEHESLFAPGVVPDDAKLDAEGEKLLESTRVVLKQEWLRVRHGEPVFRIAKFVALLVIAALVLALVWPTVASWLSRIPRR